MLSSIVVLSWPWAACVAALSRRHRDGAALRQGWLVVGTREPECGLQMFQALRSLVRLASQKPLMSLGLEKPHRCAPFAHVSGLLNQAPYLSSQNSYLEYWPCQRWAPIIWVQEQRSREWFGSCQHWWEGQWGLASLGFWFYVMQHDSVPEVCSRTLHLQITIVCLQVQFW